MGGSKQVRNNPECCGVEMTEVESKFTNELNEYKVIGYECTVCDNRIDFNGKEIT